MYVCSSVSNYSLPSITYLWCSVVVVYLHITYDYVLFSLSFTTTETSLTLHNLDTALETLPDDKLDYFGWFLNIPKSQRDRIRSQYSTASEWRTALLQTFLTSHPAPSWQHVADILYRSECHAVLERVQRMFPTGKKIMLDEC